jgi:hypothetical protein
MGPGLIAARRKGQTAPGRRGRDRPLREGRGRKESADRPGAPARDRVAAAPWSGSAPIRPAFARAAVVQCRKSDVEGDIQAVIVRAAG